MLIMVPDMGQGKRNWETSLGSRHGRHISGCLSGEREISLLPKSGTIFVPLNRNENSVRASLPLSRRGSCSGAFHFLTGRINHGECMSHHF